METLKDFNVKNKRVLVRCDFNTPLDERGNVLNDFRIKETLPTINYLMENNAKIILMSHLGDPEGKVVEILKLDKIKEKLEELLNLEIIKVDDCVGKDIEAQIYSMKPRDILLLENLRFHKEEEGNNLEFAKSLASLADLYVNDAFSVSHRNHASVAGITKFLPHCAGLLLEKEITILSQLQENPDKPLVAIIGGKKVETKSQIIDKISENADCVLVSGLIKREIVEKKLEFKYPEKIIGPIDVIDADLKVINFNEAGDKQIPDIGPETIKLFRAEILKAKTVFWNGPFGSSEKEDFMNGTKEISKAIIESNAFSIIGGGETIEFINRAGLNDKFNHISTGGGAMLSFLSGEELPGLKALEN